jgi:hypothetical protein
MLTTLTFHHTGDKNKSESIQPSDIARTSTFYASSQVLHLVSHFPNSLMKRTGPRFQRLRIYDVEVADIVEEGDMGYRTDEKD